MNNIFRVIWNKSTQSWVAVSELARGQVKSSTTSNVDVKKSKIAVSVMGALALVSAVEAQAATVVNTTTINAGNIYIETNRDQDNVLIGRTARVSGGGYAVVAIGKDSQAQGPSAIAIGSTSKAVGDAIAVGLNANSSANYAVSIGKNAASKAEGGISIGHGANVTSAGANGTAIGAGSKALNINATALGASANASNTNATAIGSGAIASNKSATAIGHSANASNINATAIGVNATARSVNATALGTNATARNVDATAIGTNATASFQNATALGTNATASRDNAIAIGLDSKASSTNSTALGVNATAAGTNVTAIGINSYAERDNATALGPHANASAANSTAIGPGAIAKGVNGVALGVGALANATSTLALGENATVNTHNSVAIGKDSKAEGQGDLVAIGTNATAGAKGTIALGKNASTSFDRAVAIGQGSKAAAADAFAAGTNATGVGPRSIVIGNNAETTVDAADGIALGSHVNASGSAAIAIGKSTKATAEVALAMVDGANASGPKSIAIGQNSQTTESQAVAIGATSKATATDAFALGSSAVASHADSVALGSRSTTNDPANEASNQFYTFKDDSGTSQQADFAANRVNSIVSVGAANAERQIHHVGAGRISPTSTDAINGSQLYHVLNKSGFNVWNKDGSVSRINNDGKVAFHDGNYTTVNVTRDAANSAVIKYHAKTQDIESEDATTITGLSTAPADQGLATAATVVAAINKAGFKIDTNNDGSPENIVNGDTLVIAKKGENIEVSRTGKKIEIGITETPTFKNVSIVNSDGGNTAKAENISAKKGAGNLDARANEESDRLVYTDSAGEEQPVATMNDGLKFTGNNENEINSHKLNSVVKIVGERDDNRKAYDEDLSAKNNIMVQADGNDTLTVKLAKDLVHLKSVTTEDAEGNKSVVNATGITITPRGGDGAGYSTGTGSPVSLTNTGLNNGGNVITNVAGHLPGAVTNHAAPETYGKLPDDWDDREIKDNIKNDAATVGDVLNAGWNLKGPQEVADADDTADHVDFVRAYDSVKFRHGKNTRVSVGTNETKTENTIKFDVDLPVAYTAADGTPLAQGENGKYYKVDGDGNITDEEVDINDENNPVSISLLNPNTKQGANNTTGEPVTLTNLKDNIGVDKTVVPHTEGQPLTKPDNFNASTNGRNAATVNDVLNAGWNAYVENATDEGNFKALVNPTDKVVFHGHKGVVVEADAEQDGVTTFKFSVNTNAIQGVSPIAYVNEDGDKLIKTPDNKFYKADDIDENGKPVDGAAEQTPAGHKLVHNDGTVTNPSTLGNLEGNLPGGKQHTDAPVEKGELPKGNDAPVVTNAATVGDVLNAGWNLKENGEDKDFVRPYDTVEFVNGNNTKVTVTPNDDKTSNEIKVDIIGLPITYTAPDGTSVVKKADGNFYKLDANGNPTEETVDAGDIITSLVNPAAPSNQAGQPITLTNLKDNIGVDDNGTALPQTAGSPLSKPNGYNAETNGRNAATVNDVLNAGWNAYVTDATDDNHKAVVNPTDKVVFKGENGVVVTAENENDQGVTTFNFSVNTTALQGSSPITYVNENGDKLIKTPDNKFYKADDIVNGKPKEDAAEQTPAGHKLVDNDGNVTTPSTLGNVAGTLTPSYNKGNPKVADSKADKDDEAQVGDVTKQVINPFNATSPDAATAEEIAKVYNNAATVGDVLNSGWNLKNNGEAKDFVKPYDTVNFVNGLGTIATVETNDEGELSNIRIDTLTTLVDSEGNLVTQIGNDFYKVEDIDPKTGKPKENATPITVDANNPLSVKVVNPTDKANKTTTAIQMGNVAAGTQTLDGTNRGDKTTADGPTAINEATNPNMKAAYEGLADLKNSDQTNVMTVADAQKLGWVVSSNKTTGALTDEYADDVRNANEVRFVGTGLATVSGKTENEVRTITVDVDTSKVSDVSPVVYTDKEGNKLVKDGDNFYPADTVVIGGKRYPAGTTEDTAAATDEATPVDKANVIASMHNVDGSTTNPMSLTNISGNLPQTVNKDDLTEAVANGKSTGKLGDDTAAAPTKSKDLKEQLAGDPDFIKNIYNNAATVGDLLNSGWNLQGNGSAVDFVKPYDTVNFVDGVGTTVVAEASEDGKTSTIKVNTLTQYTDGNGTPVTVIDGKGYPVGSVKGKDGKVYPEGTEFNEDGSPKNGETAINPTTENPQVSLVGKDGSSTTSIVLGNVAAGTNTLDGTNRGDKTTAEGPTVIDANTNPNMKAAYNGLADLKNSNQTNVMTVADAQKLGWVVSSNKTTGALADEYADDVRNANEVRFVGTGLATVSGKTENEVRTITVDVNAQKVAEAAQLPVVYTDKQGNKLVKGEDGKFYNPTDLEDKVFINDKYYPEGSVLGNDGKVYTKDTQMDPNTGNPAAGQTATEATALEPKETGDVIASMNNAEGSTTNTMALTNVSGNLPVTYNLGDNEIVDDKPTDNKITEKSSIYDAQEAPTADEVKAMYNNAATVGDVLNAGWNLQNNGEAKDFVKPYDKVNFVNGVGTIAKVTTDESGKKSDVTFDIDKGELSAKDTGALQGTTPEALEKLKEAVTAAEQPITDAKAELAEKQAALEAAKQKVAAATNENDKLNAETKLAEAEKEVEAANDKVAKAEKAKKDAEAAVAAVPNKVATVENVVKAVNDSGFTIFQDNAEAANKKALVNPGDKVVYAADGLAEVEVANETQDGVTTITYKINAQKVAETAQLPVVYTDKQGNKLVKGEDGFYPADSVVVNGKHYPKDSVVSKDGKVYPKDTPMDAQTGLPTDQNATEETALTPKTAGDVIASMNNAGNETTTPMALSNVGQGTNIIGDKKKDDETLVKVGNNYYKPADLTNGVPKPTAQPVTDGTDITQADAPVDFAKAGLADLANSNPNNALTVADARNFGWVVSTSNNKYAQAVKNAQVVDFKGYGGVEVDGKTEDGKYIIEIGLSDAGKLKAEELKNTEAGAATTSPTGRIEVDKNAGGFVSAQNVAEVINASGFKLKASEAAGGSLDQAGSATKDLANGATKATSTKGELINPGDTIDMVAGKNMTVKHDAEGRITYSTKDDVSFNTVSLDQTDQDGNKVANKPTVKLKNEQGTKVNNNKEGAEPAENPNALNISSVGTGPGAKPQNTQLTGVGSVLNTKAVTTNPGTEKPADATAEADKKLVDLVGTKDAPIADTVLDSAATVRDLANMGWVVSTSKDGAETYSDTVKNANKVDFKGENGISVTGKTSATGVREITIALAEGDVIKPNEFVITKEGEEPITAIEVVDNGVKKYYEKDNIDPTTGKPKPGTNPIEITADHKVENKGAGFVTGNKVAKAIQESGFTVGKAKAETTPATYGNADEKVNPDDELRFADGSNTKVSVGTVKAANADGSFSTTTTVKVDLESNLKGIDSIAKKPDGTGPKITLTDDAVTIGDANSKAPVTITNAGKITNVADGEISPTSKDAVNGSQLYALTGGKATTTGSVEGKDENNNTITIDDVVLVDGKPLKTYDVESRKETYHSSVVDAVQRMNDQGIQFFHTNNNTRATGKIVNNDDSSASGGFSTAVGVRATAHGDYSVALGTDAQALGENTVSIGNGNIVAGKNSGAIGDPSYITDKDQTGEAVDGSYSIGNHNVINSSNTFVLGNNVNNKGTTDAQGRPEALGNTVENSVYLGNKTTATAGNGVGTKNLKADGSKGTTTTAGDKGTVSTANVNGVVYGGFAGETANGVVSVGASGSERRIQNVAAGEISPTSTDAINGSQLYQVAAKLGDINNKMNRNNKQLRAGIAGANAAAGLPQVYIPGKSMVAAAVGTYKGQNAIAVGYSRASDNGKIILKLQGNANTNGEVGGSVGVGYQW